MTEDFKYCSPFFKAVAWFEEFQKSEALKKAVTRRDRLEPELKDVGKPNPENKSQVGHISKLGSPVWAQRPDITENHIKAVREGFPKLKIQDHNKQKLANLIQHVWKDPDHAAVASGTTKGHAGEFNELRMRHLSSAINGKDGYSVEDTPEGVKISADRHNRTGGTTSWHWDGKTLKSFHKMPNSNESIDGSYKYENPQNRRPDRVRKSTTESQVRQDDRGGLGRTRLPVELGSGPDFDSDWTAGPFASLFGRTKGSGKDRIKKSAPVIESLLPAHMRGKPEPFAKSQKLTIEQARIKFAAYVAKHPLKSEDSLKKSNTSVLEPLAKTATPFTAEALTKSINSRKPSKTLTNLQIVNAVIKDFFDTEGTRGGNQAIIHLLSLIHPEDHKRIRQILWEAGFGVDPMRTIRHLRDLQISPKARAIFHQGKSKVEAKESQERLKKSWSAMSGACREWHKKRE